MLLRTEESIPKEKVDVKKVLKNADAYPRAEPVMSLVAVLVMTRGVTDPVSHTTEATKKRD